MRTSALPTPPFDPADDQNADHTLHLSIALDWDVLFVAEAGMAWRGHEGQDSSSMIFVTPDGAQALHLEAITKMRDVKRRFIDAQSSRLEHVAFLRWQVVRFVNYELIDRSVTELGSGLRSVVRTLREGARLSPTVLLEPRAWRLVIRAMLGPRLWGRLKRFLGRPHSMHVFS